MATPWFPNKIEILGFRMNRQNAIVTAHMFILTVQVKAPGDQITIESCTSSSGSLIPAEKVCVLSQQRCLLGLQHVDPQRLVCCAELGAELTERIKYQSVCNHVNSNLPQNNSIETSTIQAHAWACCVLYWQSDESNITCHSSKLTLAKEEKTANTRAIQIRCELGQILKIRAGQNIFSGHKSSWKLSHLNSIPLKCT